VLKADYIIAACDDLIANYDSKHSPIKAIQGGAGTSTNMNVNEVIANRANQLAGKMPGDYDFIDPLIHVNKSQSTNDVYPTALRIATILLLRKTSEAFARLQESLQAKEQAYADIIKLGRTHLMDALPIMLGQEFGAYAQAIARDRWRLYKVEERLRQINLGGTGVGTGINAENAYIFAITDIIRDLTGIGLARAEFPVDLTQNQDVFVEVSGLIKSSAVNLMKISNDLRLMNSGPKGGLSEITLKPLQAGSSIMPGKVNPIIPEMVGSACIKVLALDHAITMAATMGQLELNAFVPTIAESILESLEIVLATVTIFKEKCIDVLTANEARCLELLESSSVLITALSEHIGYEKSSEVANIALLTNQTIRQVVLEMNLIPEEQLNRILNPYAVTKPGIPGK
nr:aspartate ammonia-lyase [Vallitaleaceae bacterium]